MCEFFNVAVNKCIYYKLMFCTFIDILTATETNGMTICMLVDLGLINSCASGCRPSIEKNLCS